METVAELRYICLYLTSHSDQIKTHSPFKAMLHEELFLATYNTTNVALQIARKNSRETPHFATAIVVLRVARKVERPSTFGNVARQVACV